MSNFTKSIVYSGIVMAAALIAVFAIYDNMTMQQTGMQQIEPAAGAAMDETGDAQTTPSGMDEMMQSVSEEGAAAVEGAAEAVSEGAEMAVDAASEAASDMMEAAPEAPAATEAPAEEATTPAAE